MATAANSVQIEQAQMISNDPITMQMPLEAIHPPQKPSYRQLLKPPDRVI